jgi:hypothetical protein
VVVGIDVEGLLAAGVGNVLDEDERGAGVVIAAEGGLGEEVG